MTTTSLGIHSFPADRYHADPCDPPSLSASIAQTLITSSPLHAWTAHPRLNPNYEREHEEKFDIGTAAHALLLEGREAVQVVLARDWRTDVAKEQRKEARKAGRIPILVERWDEVQAMVDAALAQHEASNADPPLFMDGKPEQTLIWQEDGVVCRARCDWLRDDYAAIDDYKTTSRSANPESWSRSLFGMGFDVQAAFYLRGLKALTGVDAEWRWVVQETSPPYALSVIGLTPAALDVASAKVEYALAKWARCIATDSWPGYPSEVCYAEIPGWEESRWLEKEAREAA